MRLSVGSDEELPLIRAVVDHFEQEGHIVSCETIGAHWIDVGRRVGEQVVRGDAQFGVVCCFTGTGVSIAANKITGVRAALCRDVETAVGARRWNDANVVALSLQSTSTAEAIAIIEAFLAALPDPEELPLLDRLENR